MSFTYDLKLSLPGRGTGTQSDPCNSGSVHVIAKAIGDTIGAWTGNVFKGTYLSSMVPLYPTSPWNWFGAESGNWDAHWSIRPVHKDVHLQVTIKEKSTGFPLASQSFWLRKGIPPAYIYVACSDGPMKVLMSPTFKYLKETDVIQPGIPRWTYEGTKTQLQAEIEAMPEVVTTVHAIDGELVLDLPQRLLLQEQRLTFFNTTLGKGKEWTTVGPVSKSVLLEALDGYEPPPGPEPEPPPEPDPNPTFTHVHVLGLRTTEGIDCGIKVTALLHDTTVHISIYKSVEPLELPAELVGGPYIYTLGARNAVAKMCKHHYNIPEADSVEVLANKPVSSEVVWMVPKSWEHDYAGLPGIEPL